MKAIVARIILSFMLLSLPSAAMAASEVYSFDKAHSRMLFFVNHAGFSQFIGEFTDYWGVLTLNDAQPEKSKVTVSIDPRSVRTPSAELDEMLQGEQYFNSMTYDKIIFESTEIKRLNDKEAEVKGLLSARGAATPVVLHVTLNKKGELGQQQRVGFSVRSTFNRSDLGMMELIPVVGDQVTFQMETELTEYRDETKKPAASPKQQ